LTKKGELFFSNQNLQKKTHITSKCFRYLQMFCDTLKFLEAYNGFEACHKTFVKLKNNCKAIKPF
jgi:hypothetical protein